MFYILVHFPQILTAIEQWHCDTVQLPIPMCDRTESTSLSSYWLNIFIRVRTFVHLRPVVWTWYACTCLITIASMVPQPQYHFDAAAYTTLLSIYILCLAILWAHMLLYIVASGGPRVFLRSFWIWVELFLNVTSLLAVTPSTRHVRWLCAVSAARPVRLIVRSAFPLHPLARGAPRLIDLVLSFCVVLLMLSLVAVLAFHEELFSNIGKAVLMVLKVAAADNWVANMNVSMQTSGDVAAFFYVVTVLLGAFFAALTNTAVNAAVSCFSDSRGIDQQRSPQSWTFSGEHSDTNSSTHPMLPSKRHASHSCIPDTKKTTTGSGRWRRAINRLKRRGTTSSQQSRRKSKLAQVAAAWLESDVFALANLLLSLVSFALLASVSAGMSLHKQAAIMRASASVALVWVVPVALRASAAPLGRFLSDPWCWVDVLCVISGILELAAPVKLFSHRAVCGLRIFRVLGICKYARMPIPMRCCKGVAVMLALIAISVVLFASSGMHLFGFQVPPTRIPPFDVPPADYGTIWGAALMTFPALYGSGWFASLKTVQECGYVGSGAVFYVLLLFWGTCVLRPLMLSYLLRCVPPRRTVHSTTNHQSIPPLFLPEMPKIGCPTSHDTGIATPLMPTHKGRSTDARLRTVLGCAFHSKLYYVVSSVLALAVVVALFFERADNKYDRQLQMSNALATAIFCLEQIVKCGVYGIWRTPSSLVRDIHAHGEVKLPSPYFCYFLNWIEFAANLLCFAGVFYGPLRVGGVLRIVRVFVTVERPSWLLAELPRILCDGWMVCLIPLLCVYSLFAILGMQFFSGRFSWCSDADIKQRQLCIGINPMTREPRVWHTGSDFSFDTFGDALLSLLALSTVSNWVPYMRLGMDAATQDDEGMSYNQSPYYVAYYIVAVVCLRLLALPLLSASLAKSSSEMLTRSVKACPARYFSHGATALRYIASGGDAELEPREGCPLALRIHRCLTYSFCGTLASFYDYVLLFLSLLCGCVLCVTVLPQWFHTAICVACLVAYGLQLTLRMTAYLGSCSLRMGGQWYFRESVNAIVLVLMLLGTAFPARCEWLRALVWLKVLQHSTLLLSPLGCLSGSLQMRWVGWTVGIYAFALLTYGAVGTQLFGIKDTNSAFPGPLNFSTLWMSILLLFGCSTGDTLPTVMRQCMELPHVGTHSAIIYFTSFTLVVNVTLGQLVLMSLVNSFGVSPSSAASIVVAKCKRVWFRRHSDESRERMPFSLFLIDAPLLLAACDNTNTFGAKPAKSTTLFSFLFSLGLHSDGEGNVHYSELVRALLSSTLGVQQQCGMARSLRGTLVSHLYAKHLVTAYLRHEYTNDEERNACYVGSARVFCSETE